jgi:hypothetical protein
LREAAHLPARKADEISGEYLPLDLIKRCLEKSPRGPKGVDHPCGVGDQGRWCADSSGIVNRAARDLAASSGGVVQLTGSVVENPQGLHLNTFRFSAKARLIVCSNVIGPPQTGQMTSLMNVGFSLIVH